MRFCPRKTAPRVVRGKVQRKNRWALTPNYWNTPQELPVLDRQRPGSGYRHLLTKKDLARFIAILPEWEELSKGLHAVILAPGDLYADGWCNARAVAVTAWERDYWRSVYPGYYIEHRALFERLEVPIEQTGEDWLCKFDQDSARAFQLLHVFTHELGHHHDRITTKSKRRASRGEDYAEEYARRYEQIIWHRYFEVFPGGSS